MSTFLLRFAGFAGAPVLSALAPFLILPVISRAVGDAGWANFSTGQAIGILGMVGVLFGWSVAGPVRVARALTPGERADILHESLRSRAITAALFVPAASLCTFLICSPDQRAESVLVAAAMALGGFSPAWFCIGEANPRALMIFDAGPKLAASAIALPLVILTGEILWYPLLLVAVTLPTFAVHAMLVLRGHDPAGEPRTATYRVLSGMAPTAAIDATGNAYGATPIPIATAGLTPSDASAFASADRVYRIGLLAVIAIGNALQAWVVDPRATDHATRQRRAAAGFVGLGLVGGAAIAVLGPWATAVVFGVDVAATPAVSALYGVAFLCISSSTSLIRNLLIPAGRYRTVFLATAASAVIGISVMMVGAGMHTAPVIALGVAAAETSTMLLLLRPALRVYRDLEDAPAA